jgi:hypothetical protein
MSKRTRATKAAPKKAPVKKGKTVPVVEDEKPVKSVLEVFVFHSQILNFQIFKNFRKIDFSSLKAGLKADQN